MCTGGKSGKGISARVTVAERYSWPASQRSDPARDRSPCAQSRSPSQLRPFVSLSHTHTLSLPRSLPLGRSLARSLSRALARTHSPSTPALSRELPASFVDFRPSGGACVRCALPRALAHRTGTRRPDRSATRGLRDGRVRTDRIGTKSFGSAKRRLCRLCPVCPGRYCRNSY